MISRNRLHSEVLKVINETCAGMSPVARSRLAVEIARGLHPVIVEQIQREVEKEVDHGGSARGQIAAVRADAGVDDPGVRPSGNYLTGGYRSSSRQVADLGRPPSGPAPGADRG